MPDQSSPSLVGEFVELADTLRSFKAICDGEGDALPEAAFYMPVDSRRPSPRRNSRRRRRKVVLGAALLTVAVAASAESAALSDAKVDQLAELIVERCVPAQRTQQLDLSGLPSTVGRLGPDVLEQLGFEKDAFVLLFETRDGPVVFAPGRSCSANTLDGGGVAYVDAVERKLRDKGYQISDADDRASPDAANVRLRSIKVPLGGKKFAVVISSYSSETAPEHEQMIYVSVVAVEK